MRLTPLDIRGHKFRSAWRGLDAVEVETFLAGVAEDYEAVVRESESRADQIRRLEARLEELSLNEALLKETLVTAQNLGDELRKTAQTQTDVLLAEAEVKAETILDAAHRRAARLSEEIRSLRGLRSRLASALRTSIGTHLSLVDALAADPDADEAVLEGELLDGDAPLGGPRASATRGPTST